MLFLSLSAALLNVIIFLVTKFLDPFQHTMGMPDMGFAMNPLLFAAQIVICFLPILSLAFAVYWYTKNKENPVLPWINTLTLTLSSIGIISGSGGGVEFHFSIFMVIAATAYYENTRLIMMMTILFAVQHLGGYLFFPQLVFGTELYPITMLLIHAGFLLLTSGVTYMQINSKRQITLQLESEKKNREDEMVDLLEQVQSVAEQIGSTSKIVSGKSEHNVISNQEMRDAFTEVSQGLGDQAKAIEQMEYNLQNIHTSIQAAQSASEEMKENAGKTEQAVAVSSQNVHSLHEHMMQMTVAISTVVETMRALNQSSDRAKNMTEMIQRVADQTNLLALNASIEAARAGEHGKGFSVVASEIRKLAHQSHEAAEEVKAIMEAIQEQSDLTSALIQNSQTVVKQSVIEVDVFADDFDQVKETITQLLAFIGKLNHMLLSIKNDSANVTDEISQISTVIEEGIAAMEELSMKCVQQIESAKQVDGEIRQLSRLNLSLQERFPA